MDTARDLVHQYADAVCRGDAEQWASCWVEDSTWSLGPGREVRGKAAIVELWAHEIARYAVVVQLVANGRTDLDVDSGSGTGRWYIHEYSRRIDGASTTLLARYDDTYRHVDDGWRFVRRELTISYKGPPDLSGQFTGPEPG